MGGDDDPPAGFEPELLQLALDGDHVVGVVYSIDYPDEVDGSSRWRSRRRIDAAGSPARSSRCAFQRSFDRGYAVTSLSTDSGPERVRLYEHVGMQ